MTPFSALSLLRQGLTGQRGWTPQWRKPEPKSYYDAINVGGGGHGLGTAYYLAREHRLTNIAVLEKGWIGGGNTGRNTTVIRSNYLFPESAAIYDHALKLWEGLSQELNYNMMFSQRGVLMLVHSVHDAQVARRHIHANHAAGVDNEWLTPEEARAFCPPLNNGDIRYPVVGAALQRRGGTARHDAVAWGYARAADARGVDLIQQCEVTGIRVDNGAIAGVETTQGYIATGKVGLAVAGHSGRLAAMAGIRLPIESHTLQALVSDPVKPVLNTVVTSGAVHFYISQSDKGELVMGGDLDFCNSYTQRGNLPMIEHVVSACLSLFPSFGRLKVMRTWGGVCDMTMDGSPIIGVLPVKGLTMTGGWCYGGFKATPASGWLHAYTIARGEPHRLNAAFTLERFARGATIDEKGAGPTPWAH